MYLPLARHSFDDVPRCNPESSSEQDKKPASPRPPLIANTRCQYSDSQLCPPIPRAERLRPTKLFPGQPHYLDASQYNPTGYTAPGYEISGFVTKQPRRDDEPHPTSRRRPAHELSTASICRCQRAQNDYRTHCQIVPEKSVRSAGQDCRDHQPRRYQNADERLRSDTQAVYSQHNEARYVRFPSNRPFSLSKRCFCRALTPFKLLRTPATD
jgi:hypothetical protein